MKRKIALSIAVMFSFLVFAQNAQNGSSQPELIKHINKQDFLNLVWNFEKNPQGWVYEGKLPCIIDFYASWCGPCRRLAPILEEIAEEYKGQIVVYKVDTQVEKELAAAFGISSIPTLFFCPMAGSPQLAKGLLPKETLQQAVNEVLLGK